MVFFDARLKLFFDLQQGQWPIPFISKEESRKSQSKNEGISKEESRKSQSKMKAFGRKSQGRVKEESRQNEGIWKEESRKS